MVEMRPKCTDCIRKTPNFPFKLTVKRAVTILLMSILAFNWLGYRLLSSYLEHRSDVALVQKIDRQDYDESHLIELRVPLNAPYLSGSDTEFERIDGEVIIEGTHYNYVKRKVENGELVLMCIPNEGKTKILSSRVDFFKMVNDVDQSSEGKSKNTGSFKSFTTEYRQENNSWNIPRLVFGNHLKHSSFTASISTGFDAIPEQPPRA